jgi:hypothetical protein
MTKFNKYNIQIFLSWLFYIALGYKLPEDAIKLINDHYKATPREKRLFERIKKKINKKVGNTK